MDVYGDVPLYRSGSYRRLTCDLKSFSSSVYCFFFIQRKRCVARLHLQFLNLECDKCPTMSVAEYFSQIQENCVVLMRSGGPDLTRAKYFGAVALPTKFVPN